MLQTSPLAPEGLLSEDTSLAHPDESLIKLRQRTWAESIDLTLDAAGYCMSPDSNLPWLSPQTRAEFESADGNEFGSDGARAKIAALHSSSALAVNLFDYWRM